MQFFVSRKGQRLGPYSIFRITELLDDGELSPDDLGWHQGRDIWVPLREIPALIPAIETKRERDFLRESGKPLDSGKAKRGRERGSGSRTSDSDDQTDGGEADADADADAASSSDSATVAGIAPRPGSPAAAKANAAGSSRPITRFWARIFDFLLVTVLVYAFFGPPPMPDNIKNGSASFAEIANPEFWQSLRRAMETDAAQHLAHIQQIALVLWVLLEGYLLHRFGTTPGKALFGIRVTQVNGSRLGLQQSMLRAFFVWFIGVGMWWPFVTLATLAFSLWSLLARGSTIWDRQLATRVQQGKLSIARIALAFVAFVFILLIQQTIVSRG